MPTIVRRLVSARDLLLALALCMAAWFELVSGAQYSGRPVWPGPVLATAVVIPVLTLPLAWRRRRPLLVCLFVLSAVTVSVVLLGGGEATSEFLLFIAVVFSGAAYTDKPALVAGAALGAGAVHELRDPSVNGVGDVVWAFGMLVIAFMLGRAVRARQQRISALQDEAVEREVHHAEQVASATAAERAAIARELHDIVAHAVSVVVIQAQAGSRALPDRPEVAAATLSSIEHSARGALTDLRRLLTVLGGEEDRGSAPVGSLVQLADLVRTFTGSGIEVSLEVPDVLPNLSAAAELAAYRVVQEALTNAARHARGSRVTVSVCVVDGDLDVRVVNTAGEPASAVAGLGAGRGLIGMRQRLGLVGGQLLAATPVGGGYEVHARIPVCQNALVPEHEPVA